MRKRIQEERMTEEKNMTRREIREQVFKMLFRVEFYNQEEAAARRLCYPKPSAKILWVR